MTCARAGPRGSRCSVHVDTFGSHFWMILFDGRKRWRIWTAEAAAALCPSFAHGHDAIFDDAVADDIDDDGIGGGGGGGDDDGDADSDDDAPRVLVSCVDRCDATSANSRRILGLGESCRYAPAGTRLCWSRASACLCRLAAPTRCEAARDAMILPRAAVIICT